MTGTSTGKRPRSRVRTLAWIVGGPPLMLAWAWVAGSLVYFERWPPAVGVAAACAWGLALGLGAWRFGTARVLAYGGLVGAAWIAVFCALQGPRSHRPWDSAQARSLSAEFESDGRHVVIDNLRSFRYRSDAQREELWESRRFDLDTLSSVDFVIEPLPALPGMAHVLLSFGFEDGRYLAISVEVRREVGETYSPLAGLFRRYELIYIAGDERDLLGLRLNLRGHDLLVHPLRVDGEHAAALLSSMLLRGEELATRPEFYDSLSNSCSTNLLRHFEGLRGASLPFAWQAHLPLHADQLAWELDLIEGAASLAEARTRHRVRGPSPAGLSEREFSLWLRGER